MKTRYRWEISKASLATNLSMFLCRIEQLYKKNTGYGSGPILLCLFYSDVFSFLATSAVRHQKCHSIWSGMPQNNVNRAGKFGWVLVDNETHESAVTKCTTGEALSAFHWHRSSWFHCQWTYNQVFLILSHMLIHSTQCICIYVLKYLSDFISKLRVNFTVSLMKLDETICYCWCPIVMKCSPWLQQVVTMVLPLWYHTLS